MLSTNDILALLFGIGSTIIGVATALNAYMRRAPEVPEDLERQITHELRSTFAIAPPPPILVHELAPNALERRPSTYNHHGRGAGRFHALEMIDGGPPPYSNASSPVTITGVKTPAIDPLPEYIHLSTTTQDMETSLPVMKKTCATYFHSPAPITGSKSVIHAQAIKA